MRKNIIMHARRVQRNVGRWATTEDFTRNVDETRAFKILLL